MVHADPSTWRSRSTFRCTPHLRRSKAAESPAETSFRFIRHLLGQSFPLLSICCYTGMSASAQTRGQRLYIDRDMSHIDTLVYQLLHKPVGIGCTLTETRARRLLCQLYCLIYIGTKLESGNCPHASLEQEVSAVELFIPWSNYPVPGFISSGSNVISLEKRANDLHRSQIFTVEEATMGRGGLKGSGVNWSGVEQSVHVCSSACYSNMDLVCGELSFAAEKFKIDAS